MKREKRFVGLDKNNIVFYSRTGKKIKKDEIESDTAEVGQKYENGEFITLPVEPIEEDPYITNYDLDKKLDTIIQFLSK